METPTSLHTNSQLRACVSSEIVLVYRAVRLSQGCQKEGTRHWAENALWFDIPPFASRGLRPALKFFDKVFSGFQTCKIDILEMEVVVNGSMGVVCTIQRVNVVLKTGDSKSMVVRETDCFEKREGDWKLFHQHASVPAGGSWDGEIVTD